MKDIWKQTDRLSDEDPFGLRKLNFRVRVPEKSEMFSREEAITYIKGCDYPASVDDWLLARELGNLFGLDELNKMHILDAMSGPGRLGREISHMGAKFVMAHDGDQTMIAHNRIMALLQILTRRMGLVQSPVENIPLPNNSFDLIVCHNSIHQLGSLSKLQIVIDEFLRLTKPGGHVVIADYQRGTSMTFLSALEERLRWTKSSIVPLLLPTFRAAFSKEEWKSVLQITSNVASWSVKDAEPPLELSAQEKLKIKNDPVRGHILDFSPISLRVSIQKEGI